MIKFLYTQELEYIGELKYSKNVFSNYRVHSHCMLSFGMIEKGSLNIQYKDSCITLSENTIAIFNPYQVHKTTDIDKAQHYYVLYLDSNWCEKIQLNLKINLNNYIPIATNKINNNEMLNLCQNIFHNINDNSSCINQLVDLIKKIFLEYCHIDKTNNTLCILSEQMKKYIYENIDSNISAKDIANKLGYNQSYLNRIFKKNTGMTPQEFIINKKINRAKKSVILSPLSDLTTIAYDNGFYDQSHFIKNFKKIFATNPSTYKKSKLYNK